MLLHLLQVLQYLLSKKGKVAPASDPIFCFGWCSSTYLVERVGSEDGQITFFPLLFVQLIKMKNGITFWLDLVFLVRQVCIIQYFLKKVWQQ